MPVLGIDVGGTKAVGCLTGASGEILLETRGPGATLQAGGEVAVEQALQQVIVPARRAAATGLCAVCVGMAGVERPDEARVVSRIVERLARTPAVLVVNDALIALEAGVAAGPGIVIVAGTGSIAFGRDAAGRAARAGGWGHILGDEGSGYWIGRQALFAVVRAADGRGPKTSLGPKVLAHFQVGAAQDLVREVYFRLTQPAAIGALGGLVAAAAADGDEVARAILVRAAEELTSAGLAVAHALALDACPILLSGGVFLTNASLAGDVTARLQVALPRATVRPLDAEPVAGAVRLAAALAGGAVAVPAYVSPPV